jgi:hypothetical protein
MKKLKQFFSRKKNKSKDEPITQKQTISSGGTSPLHTPAAGSIPLQEAQQLTPTAAAHVTNHSPSTLKPSLKQPESELHIQFDKRNNEKTSNSFRHKSNDSPADYFID